MKSQSLFLKFLKGQCYSKQENLDIVNKIALYNKEYSQLSCYWVSAILAYGDINYIWIWLIGEGQFSSCGL